MTQRWQILEPEGGASVTLQKSGDLVCVWCECDGVAPCPQGKRGSQTRCRVWLKRSSLTVKAIEREKRMNRFDR